MNKFIMTLLAVYKKAISPALTVLFGQSCRYSPTCSEYAHECFKRFGFLKALRLSVSRLLRCHPFSNASNFFDPVPLN